MKKSLVALAALAATSAFAQVTLTGNMDFANANVAGTQLWAKGNTISQTVGVASTSVINIRAEENLGGGVKATAHYGLDPRSLANDSFAVTNNTAIGSNNGIQTGGTSGLHTGTAVTSTAVVGGQSNTATGLARDEVFVGIEGGFGNLRLGAPNSIGLNSFQVSSPLGTGIGSSYTGGGTAGTMTNSYVQTRYNRSMRWDSPVMNGFQAAILYAPGNDIAATTTGFTSQSATTGQISPATPVANLIPNARKGTELGLRYANGPLTVSWANIAQADQLNTTGWYANVAGSTALKTSVNLLNASYNFGATTVYAGWNSGSRLAPNSATNTAAVDTKGARVAVKHTSGAFDIMAQYSTQEAMGVTGVTTSTAVATLGNTSSNTAVLKASVIGFRADYNMSKTAAVYMGYEKYDTGAAYDAKAPGTTGDRTIVSVGLKKSF